MAITTVDKLTEWACRLERFQVENLLEVLNGMPWDDDYNLPQADFFLHLAKSAMACRKKQDQIACDICGCTVPDIDKAIEAGWAPETWYSETEPGPGPICLECYYKFVDGDDNIRSPGEFLC